MLRQEVISDHLHVRDLHKRAFGGTKVSDLTDALRSAPAPLQPLSFVADLNGQIVGHVMLSASRLDAPRQIVDVYVLSPIGVNPEFQRRGLGTALLNHAVEAADRMGVPLVFLEGDPAFYSQRRFQRASELGFRSPSLRIPDPAFQVCLLAAYETWMTGTLVYSDTFWRMDSVGLRTSG